MHAAVPSTQSASRTSRARASATRSSTATTETPAAAPPVAASAPAPPHTPTTGSGPNNPHNIAPGKAVTTPNAPLTSRADLTRQYRMNHPEPDRLLLVTQHHRTGLIRTHRYINPDPDWTNQATISHLNHWRNQIRARNDPPHATLRNAIVPFTENERRLARRLMDDFGLRGFALADAFNRANGARYERTSGSLVAEVRMQKAVDGGNRTRGTAGRVSDTGDDDDDNDEEEGEEKEEEEEEEEEEED